MGNCLSGDANDLISLDIGLRQALMRGDLTLDHYRWFVGLSRDDRDRVMRENPAVLRLIRAPAPPSLGEAALTLTSQEGRENGPSALRIHSPTAPSA